MAKIAKALIPIYILLLFLSINISKVAANDELVGYSVRAIIPQNQIKKDITYFDLLVEPNQEQVINVEIFNSSQEDIEIDVYITNPKTNRNGIIDYTDIKAKPDESLKVPITEIATIQQKTVAVPKGETRIVPINLKIPEKEFAGTILGGIYFEKKMKDTEKKSEGVQILNKYSYVLGLKLTENKQKIEPELNLQSVKPELVDYHTSIIAKLQNTTPVIVENLAINAIVYNSKGIEENRLEVEGYKMAPVSTMDVVIDWKNRKLKPGKYTLKLHANSGSNNWDWEETFNIEKEEAQAINEKAIEITKDYTVYIVVGFSTITLLLLGIIILLLRKNNRLKKDK